MIGKVFLWLFRIATGLVVLSVIAVVLIYWFASRSLPDYDKTLTVVGLSAPVEIVRDNANVPHVFGRADADVFFGLNKDAMHVIDKQSLEIVKTLRPAPGKTVAHVEFTKDGSHALVSIWEDDGAVIVYDAQTLEEVRRLPMRKPSGKYNVWNKITFSEGTSH